MEIKMNWQPSTQDVLSLALTAIILVMAWKGYSLDLILTLLGILLAKYGIEFVYRKIMRK